jgi:hypothetical protein
MKRPSNIKRLLAAVLSILAAILWHTWPKAPVNEANISSFSIEEKVRADQATIAAELLAFRWAPGAHQSYDFEMTTGADLAQTSQPQTVIRGTYHTLFIESSENSTDMSMVSVLTNAEYRSLDRRMSLLEDLFEQVPCLIQFDRTGRIRRINIPEYVKGEDVSILRGMNSTQVVLSERRSNAWQTKEADENGETAVAYSLAGPATIRKQRLRYTKLNIIGVENLNDIGFRDSSFDIRLGPCWIDSYKGGETITFSADGAEGLDIRLDVSMERLNSGQQPPPVLEALKGMSAEEVMVHLGADSPPIVRQAGAESVSSMAKHLIERDGSPNLSFDDATKAILDALASNRDNGSDVQAINALAKLLRRHPEHAFDVLKVLSNSSDITPQMSAALIHALELSGGNAESQQVLAALAGDFRLERFNEQIVAQAAFAAAGLGEIKDEALMSNLFRLAFGEIDPRLDRARDNSVLSLGVLSKFFPDMRAALADEFHRILSADAQSSIPRKMTALMSMENGAIKDPRLEEQAKDLLAHSTNVELRVCALDYLGADDKYLDLVKKAVKEDREEIQLAGVNALANREQVDEESVALMLDLLNDTRCSEDLRCHVAFKLDGLRGKNPSIEPAFKALVRQLEQQSEPQPEKSISDTKTSDGLLGALKIFIAEGDR